MFNPNPFRNLSATCCVVLAGLLPLSGCASAERRQERLAQLAGQRDNYSRLLTDLQDKALEKGSAAALIKKKYGDPSSVFRSGSTEIWIFRNVGEDNVEDDSAPIRLYFEDNKLLVWHY